MAEDLFPVEIVFKSGESRYYEMTQEMLDRLTSDFAAFLNEASTRVRVYDAIFDRQPRKLVLDFREVRFIG